MTIKSSLLQNELALVEIRKHKWIESEKAGYEIGFATAACDWIKKYSQAWQTFRQHYDNEQNIFMEKRQYRRFSHHFPVELKIENHNIRCQTHDFNLLGFSCFLPEAIRPEVPVRTTILFTDTKESSQKATFQFETRAHKIMNAKERPQTRYKVFFPFDEKTRDYLRNNIQSLITLPV